MSRPSWPWRSTLALTVFVLLGSNAAADMQEGERALLDPFARVLLLLGTLMLLWRWRRPVVVVFGTAATAMVYLGAGYPYGPVFLTVAVGCFSAVVTGHRKAAWTAMGALWAGHVLVAHWLYVWLPPGGDDAASWVALPFATGVFLVDGVARQGGGALLTLVWVLPLGLLATLPLGAVIGSLVDSPRAVGLLMFPVLGLVVISGVYFPLSKLPEWLQTVGQIFPVYWLGLGLRSALLPGEAVAAEIDASWRHWETAAVLGAWTVAGLLLAPSVLRRMARRESGAAMAERQRKAMQRVG